MELIFERWLSGFEDVVSSNVWGRILIKLSTVAPYAQTPAIIGSEDEDVLFE